jgi:cell division protein ZapA (FtsZ GTPase activity inhibitor)
MSELQIDFGSIVGAPQEVATGTADAALSKVVPQIARMIQTPTIRPETILEVAASIDAQAKGIEEAVRFGQQARAEVVTAIVTAQESMSASARHLNQSVVELVTRARKPLELPPAPELPASVTERAAELLPVK